MQGCSSVAIDVAIKDSLLTQKSSILNSSAGFPEQADIKSGDEADQAASEINQNLSWRLQERDRSLLKKIDHALAKFDNGTFGLCEACGEELNKKRLMARPMAILCIDCKEEQEHHQRFFA